MPKHWENYKTTEQMAIDVASATDCKRFCSGCAHTWGNLSGMVHMVEDMQNKTDCDSPHKFYCDGCYEEVKKEVA